jgi:hypothetical protein
MLDELQEQVDKMRRDIERDVKEVIERANKERNELER